MNSSPPDLIERYYRRKQEPIEKAKDAAWLEKRRAEQRKTVWLWVAILAALAGILIYSFNIPPGPPEDEHAYDQTP
jgi:hypothetical protein